MIVRAMLCQIQFKTRKNCFRYLKLMSPLNVAISTTISYTLWDEWYYLKNNYLTLRSRVKVPQRSLRYATHCLMVMHPHTKYHWPISKDKNVMNRTSDFFFCFFSAKLVRTITFLSFQIGQLYLVCGCMTIRRCVAYRNDLHGTLTFDPKVK
jgi:hypothetical protein